MIDTLQKVLPALFGGMCGSWMLMLCVSQELVTVDNDIKTKFNQYNSVKTNLAALQRRQT